MSSTFREKLLISQFNTPSCFHSVHQLYAINPARMQVFAPNQTPALVLEDGVGVHVVKVRAASVSYDFRKKAIKCVNACTA